MYISDHIIENKLYDIYYDVYLDKDNKPRFFSKFNYGGMNSIFLKINDFLDLRVKILFDHKDKLVPKTSMYKILGHNFDLFITDNDILL